MTTGKPPGPVQIAILRHMAANPADNFHGAISRAFPGKNGGEIATALHRLERRDPPLVVSEWAWIDTRRSMQRARVYALTDAGHAAMAADVAASR